MLFAINASVGVLDLKFSAKPFFSMLPFIKVLKRLTDGCLLSSSNDLLIKFFSNSKLLFELFLISNGDACCVCCGIGEFKNFCFLLVSFNNLENAFDTVDMSFNEEFELLALVEGVDIREINSGGINPLLIEGAKFLFIKDFLLISVADDRFFLLLIVSVPSKSPSCT